MLSQQISISFNVYSHRFESLDSVKEKYHSTADVAMSHDDGLCVSTIKIGKNQVIACKR